MESAPLIRVYTDGSSLGNPGPGGWAWWRHERCWNAGSLPHTTNQQAELVAILMALKQVPAHARLQVVSDSRYGVNLAKRWLKEWKRAGWRTASGQPVANLGIVKHIDTAISARQYAPEFIWVRGHSGVAGNEHADRAAVAAAHAERSGRVVPTAPGWTPEAAPKRTPAESATRQFRAKVSARVENRNASRDQGKSPGTVRPDGALLGARPEEGLSVMKCSSCGMTLHPLSLDCRCTR
jgi:ribonuclease HI